MKKLVIVALSAVLAVMAIEPAHAQDQKVLAIIDTAIDSNKVSSVIYEACFTDSKAMACPNGEKFMEGKGAASATFPASISKPVYHGHNVVQSVLAIDPTVKIVFVRVSDVTKNGEQAAFQVNPVVLALKWVSENASKYGIDAVATSQASNVADKDLLHPKFGASRLSEYNASCVNSEALSAVSSLSLQNIPVFAATGNNASASRVGFPACVSGVYGVGALIVKSGKLETATNRGVDLDLVAPNSIKISNYKGNMFDFMATSAATPIAAAVYVGSNKTIDSLISSFPKVAGYPYISK